MSVRTALCKILVLGNMLVLAMAVAAAAEPVLRAPGGGTIRTLIVGIDKYPRLGRAAELGGAVADAKDIAAALASAGVPAVPLLNGQATRARFVAEMDRLVAESKAGDFVFVSFAGHGMTVREYPRWKGIEDGGWNEQIVFSGYAFTGSASHEIVVNKELRAWLVRLDAKGVDVLVVMDSCFGGGMVRSADFRTGPMSVRRLSGDASNDDRESFVPIDMTEKEARTEIRSLSRVTFLAGATKGALVPETQGLELRDPKALRGALSFYVARAVDDAVSKGGSLTLGQLFGYVSQNVGQASSGLQTVDIEPRIPSARQRLVLATTGTPAVVALADVQVPRPSPADPVRVAVINGSPASLATIDKGTASFVAASSVAEAELVWDLASRDAIAHGDIIMRGVDRSLLGAVIDRTWAVRSLNKLSAPRTLVVGLRENGKIYVPGDRPEIVAGGIRGRYLTVFNIAADGELQMLFPTHGRDPHIDSDEWTYQPVVEMPFGVDHVVAVTTAQPADRLLKWLNDNNHKRAAALVPDRLAELIASDTTWRLGSVGLYTSASRN
jgi:hypothetical protein